MVARQPIRHFSPVKGFAANNSARAQLTHLFRAQTQTGASKPLKCGTSAIFD